MRPSPLSRRLFVLSLAGVGLSACMRTAPGVAVAELPPGQGGVYVPAEAGFPQGEVYALDSGDKLRVSVFGQEGIGNTYLVDVAGNVNVALIGAVPARGYTTQELARAIAARLRNGYVRDPRVSVEVEVYRPFYILGEVNAPGQYPYVANMTVETAVAIAGGFSPRAEKHGAKLSRNVGGQTYFSRVPTNTAVRPGDTINVAERWF
jgi:polysaccharide export outer membrane protein